MTFSLESDLDRIPLDSSVGYRLGRKTTGFGVPTKLSRFTRGAGPGANYRGTRTDTRTAKLEVIIRNGDPSQVKSALRRLTDIVLPQDGAALPRVVADFPDGTALTFPFVYVSGLEINPDSFYPTVAMPLISVECPDPFWTARDALQFAVESDATATPFLDDLANLPVGSSTAIGSRVVSNPGDVPADLTLVVQGPSSGNVTVMVNGKGWVFQTPLSPSETITIARTRLGVTVLDQAGVNRYADLGSAPKFAQLAPGNNEVDVTMVGATSQSRVSGFWKPRYEGVY